MAWPLSTLAAQEQDTSASTLLVTAAELASRGDTAAAISTLGRATRRFPGLAEAHYHRGLLLSRMAGTALSDHMRRAEAKRDLERALELDRHNPRYLLELGRLRLKMPFLRIEAGRLFRRAEEEARARNDAAVLADVETELADIHVRRADNAQNRRIVTGGALRFDPNQALADWRYAQNFITEQSSAVEDAGEQDRRRAEDYFRAALTALSTHQAAASGLLGLLYDAARFEEYLGVARRLARDAPSSALAQLALGLGLARTGRDAEAAAALDSALALMPPTDRRAIEDLSPILRRTDADAYQRLSASERREAQRIYWAGSDPLRLTAVNEHRIEHLARVAYANIRYTAPELHLRGWETDRGVIYIRYGPPPVAVSFAPNTEGGNPEQIGKITTVWWYPERRLRFVFYGTPGYNVARFSGDFLAYAEDARYAAPVRYDNVPVNEALDSIPVQVARFRDPRGAPSVVFFAGIPVAHMLSGIDLTRSTLQTGIFISDRLERDIFQRRREEPVDLSEERQFESRTFEVALDPGEYRYRLEALEPTSRRAARGAAMLEVGAPRTGVLDLSDVVLANNIAPRTEPPRDRRDFFIDPNPAQTFAPGQRVHLYWEIYGLRPDSAGVGSYTVSVTIRLQSIERRGVVARLVGGAADAIGTTGEGDDRVTLAYASELAVGDRDRVPEYLAVDLGDSPEGLYSMEISVQDRHSRQTVVRTRSLHLVRGARR
ncbi:MAG: GWxTD domain-containing protein [Gemmatimonadota bacterium]